MKTIQQTRTFNAPAHGIFEALMDSKKHSQFTGNKAAISRKAGGKFTAYDNYIEGKNLQIVEDQKIVQSWRASDWHEGHFSKVTFELKETGKKTKLNFTHENVPEEHYDGIKQGWIDFYWKPLKKMVEK